MRPRGTGIAALAVVGALLLPARAGARPAAEVPRDEPEPMEPGDELPDYGPPVLDEGAPASRPAPVVPPLVYKRAPRLKLTYQRFVDHKIGGEPTPYDVGAVTFFPLSEWVRLGATVRFGVEEGTSKRGYFVDVLVTAGLQWVEALRGFTPFVDFTVGPGFRMFTTFNNSLPSLQWTFGLDAGAEVHLSGRLYVSAAVGWTRPVVSLKQASVGRQTVDVYGDTFIFKVGLGL